MIKFSIIIPVRKINDYVKESIEKLHGNFSVNSEIGIGTTFTLTLPKN